MSVQSDLQRLLNSGESSVVLRGRYDLDGPLELPNWPFTLEGSGIESTDLVFADGCDGLIGRASGYYEQMPFTLRNLTLSQRGQGGTAISLSHPPAASVNEPTATIEHVTVRPSPTLGTRASWSCAGDFTHTWNMNLHHFTAHGHNGDQDGSSFLMQTGLHFRGGCQDVHVTHLRLTSMETGVHMEAAQPGEGEGLIIAFGHIIGANTCIRLESHLPGGHPTPLFNLSAFHLAYHQTGIRLINRSQCVIQANCYASQHAIEHAVGIHATGCRELKVLGGSSFMSGRPLGIAYGVLVDDCEYANISGAHFDTSRGLWFTKTTRKCVSHGNTYGPHCTFPVSDERPGYPNRNTADDNKVA